MALNHCFSCNGVINSAYHIFGNLTLQSKRKLEEVLSEIIEKPLKKNAVHSQFICKKCYTVVSEYDSLKIRSQVIKQELTSELKNTLPHYNLDYETFGQSPIKSPARLVLPASKLQPIPANYVLDMGKMASMSKAGLFSSVPSTSGLPGLFKVTTTTAKPSVNLTVTVGSTVLTQTLSSSITKTRPKITVSTTNTLTSPQKSTDYHISDKIISSLVTNRTSVKKNPVLSFNVNSLPKEFLSSAVSNKTAKEEKEDDNIDNNDDNTMEIDEACTFSVAVATDEDGKIVFENKPIDIKSKSNFFDVGLLLSQDGARESDKEGKYNNIMDKLKMLNHGDDEDDTIVMEDGKTTIIRMVSGQKVFLDGNKISLVQGSDNDGIDNGDSLDSNDEPQIELQVSGDEEIANALINAAQGQGGAFIKVESGEMYRVESVQSKRKDESDSSHLQNIVERESDDGNVYRCLLCQHNMKNEEPVNGDAETIMAHLKNVHNARAYICLVCGVVMRKRTEYNTHLESHTQGKTVVSKSKLYHCAMCTKKFNSKTLLTTHMNMHAGNRPYACAVCGKAFASKYTHQAHMKTHSTRPRPYKCDQCGKTFFTQQNLSQHEKTHSGLKEFICPICNKAFATQHNLEVHGVIHSGLRPYSCPICSKSFARRAEIRDHMRIHTGERPFACDICGATFTQRSNLHSHKRATHLDDKRHLCTQCPKRFKRRRLLDYHLKAVHTGERPLQCSICRATFVYPEHYKKHARIHSGEKPYICEVCGKSFNSRDNRNMHRFVHSDKKPYECLTCGAGYMRKQLLYTHMNTMGHIAESIVVNQPRVIKTVENGITAPVIDVHGMQIKTNNLTDSILDEQGESELDENHAMTATESDENPKLYTNEDKKIILQDKSTLNLVQNSEDPSMLMLNNVSAIEWKEGTELDKLHDEQQIIPSDKGGTMRLIQIQLTDGNTGWVAIDPHETLQ